MDWDKLRIFHAAAEAGSFTHAGEALRMSQSAVSRQVSALEKELNVSLFHRHARGLVLTEQGEMLFGTASEIMNKLSTAETLLTRHNHQADRRSEDHRPDRGSAPVWVTQRLREFLELYPDIRIELVLTDEQIGHRHARGRRGDLDQRAAAERADQASAVQHEDCTPSHLRNYIRRHGAPQSIAALDDHPIISLQRHAGRASVAPSAGWRRPASTDEPPRKPAFAANSVIAMKYAIRAGIGIGLIPDYLTGGETDLVPVLQ